MNSALVLTCNNLDLNKRCIDSLRGQDIPVEIMVIDNGSTDGTPEWLNSTSDLDGFFWPENRGVSAGWNYGIHTLFAEQKEAQHILIVGSDTVLAPWTYSALLSANVPFVTGVDIGMSPLPDRPDVFPLSPHPDFSCFLIRRECWDKVGRFDERMMSYASDCSYHIEAHRLGVQLWKASVPYNHERSSTMNRSSPGEKAKISMQANRDRMVFQSIYGCLPGTPAYNNLFKEVAVGQAEAQ